MKTIPLYICDSDEIYLNRLNGYIQHQERSSFNVRTYTKFSEIRKLADPKGILMLSERYITQLDEEELRSDFWKKWKKIIVVDEGGHGQEMYAQISAGMGMPAGLVRKYQSAKGIYMYLLEHCLDSEDFLDMRGTFGEKKTACITGIYTPEDKGLLNDFCEDYIRKLPQKALCLYIDFEEFGHSDDAVGSLSDLIWLIKEGNRDILVKMEEHVVKEGHLERLLPPVCPYDLKEVSGAEWSTWLESVMLLGKYEEIVINFGNLLPDVEILELCTRILLPCTAKTQCKCARFQEMLVFMGKGRICKKIEICKTGR